MERQDIYRQLCRYNEDELFYKELYLSRDHPERQEQIIAALGLEEIKRRELMIPALSGEENQPLHMGDGFFAGRKHQNVYLSKHNRYTPPYEHDHEFFEMIYLLSGECVNHIFGTDMHMKAGDLCMMSPAVRHSIWTEEGVIINILIRRGTIQNVFYNLLRERNIISDFFMNSLYLRDFATSLTFRTNGDQRILEQILGMYGEQLEPDEYSESIVRSMLMIFFNKLIRSYKDTAAYPQTVQKQNEAAARILNIVLNDYSDITLSKLARMLGYSSVYCSRYIKQVLGCTFMELRGKVRFQKAEDYLQNTTISIAEISALCGYENPENFNRAFRQIYHISPSEYRLRVRNTLL